MINTTPKKAPKPEKEEKEVKLTNKQTLFIEEYLIDLNATQAAIRAGYSEHTAGAIGKENLQKPQISKLIQEAMDKRSDKLEITRDRVLQELARLGFSDVRNLFTDTGQLVMPKDMDDFTAAGVQSIEVVTSPHINDDGEKEVQHIHKIKFVDKRATLDMLMRHLGEYDKDNAQKADPFAEILERVANSPLGSPQGMIRDQDEDQIKH